MRTRIGVFIIIINIVFFSLTLMGFEGEKVIPEVDNQADGTICVEVVNSTAVIDGLGESTTVVLQPGVQLQVEDFSDQGWFKIQDNQWILSSAAIPCSGEPGTEISLDEMFDCWQVTATAGLNVRETQSQDRDPIDFLYFEEVFAGSDLGMGWIELATGGFTSRNWVTPSECQWVEFSNGMFIKDVSTEISPEQILALWDILEENVIAADPLCGDDLDVFFFFGDYDDMERYHPSPNERIRGFATYVVRDGDNLSRYDGGLTCESLSYMIFVRTDMEIDRQWLVLSHEMSHAHGAEHGALSPVGVENINRNLTGFADTYWIDGQFELALAGDCGRDPTEFCTEVQTILDLP